MQDENYVMFLLQNDEISLIFVEHRLGGLSFV
jgi:hypothetical protein